MRIRKIERPDFAEVLTLMRRHAEIENYADIFAVDEHGFGHPGQERSSSGFEVLVAEAADGSVVGYALYLILGFSFRQRPLLYLNDLMVDERQRRHGIARQLFEQVCREAKNHGCFRVKWGVSGTNDQAIAFYEAMGATREVNKLYFTLDEASFLGQ